MEPPEIFKMSQPTDEENEWTTQCPRQRRQKPTNTPKKYIIGKLKETVQFVEKNKNLTNKFYKLALEEGLMDARNLFEDLVKRRNLLDEIYDDTDLGFIFFGVFLMTNTQGTPYMVFAKRGFRPELMKSMTFVTGFYLIYDLNESGELVMIEVHEWIIKEPTKVQTEPVHHPSMDTDFPPLVPLVVKSSSEPEPEHVEEIPVQKIDVVKSSRDSKVLDDVRLSSLRSFAKGDMTEEELLSIFRNLPTV